MRQDIWQNCILFGNALLYTLTMFYFWKKGRTFNTSVFLLLLYTISAWAAIPYYNHELFSISDTLMGGISIGYITVEPFIWLYIVLMLFMFPFLQIRSDKIHTIIMPDIKRLIIYIKIATVLNILSILLLIPELQKLQGTWNDIRNAQMTEDGINFWFTGTILSQFFGLSLSLMCINIMLAFYLFIVKPIKSRWNIIYFFTTIISNILFHITLSGRGMILMIFVYLFFVFIFFGNFILKKNRKIIMRWGLVVGVCVIIFFVIVTLSRYGDMVMFSIYRYAGEPMLNFNTLMYDNLRGSTGGQAYFNIFTKYFYPENLKFTGTGKWYYILEQTGVDAHIFYTFVGALCFDLGKIGVLICALFFCIISCKILYPVRGQISLGVLVYYSVMTYMFVVGVFYFTFQGSNGNFTLIMAFLMLWYLKPKQYVYQTKRLILVQKKKI